MNRANVKELIPADERIERVGYCRPGSTAASVILSWSASGVRFHFRGTSVTVEVTDEGDGSETNRLSVWLDGARVDHALQRGKNTVTLGHGLPDGEHAITLLKRTEPFVGDVTLESFATDDHGELLAAAAAAPRRRIEVIGDSLATGYGVSGGPDSPAFRSDEQDVFLAYPWLLAERFDADVAVVAWSGRGAYRDAHDNRVVPTLPALWRDVRADRAPDAVVIAIGHNDFHPGIPAPGRFAKELNALVHDVEKRYSDAHIVLCAPMAPSKSLVESEWWLGGPLTAGVALHHRRRVAFCRLPPRDDALGLGALWHPGPRMQHRLADSITAVLRRHLE